MHLIVPFAGTRAEAGRQTLQSLPLPQLERLLARLTLVATLGSDETSLNPPHEQAFADALGWPAGDAALPWAARLAEAHGLDPAGAAWALLTPVHLQADADQVTLVDPAALELGEAESRALLDIVRPLFDDDGFALHWIAPTQWLARHALFDGLATASLDRAIGRDVDPWVPGQPAARLLRRLQNEVQMLLHLQPLNEQREARGLPTVNSVWLSGCGRLPDSAAATAQAPQLDDRLRAPALAEDWAAWREAWLALDAGPISALLAAAQGGSSAPCLTLCGEHLARRFEALPRPWTRRLIQRWRQPPAHTVLEAL